MEVIVENTIEGDEFDALIKVLNTKIKDVNSIPRTRNYKDYIIKYNERDKIDEIRKIPYSIRLNFEDRINKSNLIMFDIFDVSEIENPFVINGDKFYFTKRGSIDEDLKVELLYHHGGDSQMHNFGTSNVKNEFIQWLSSQIPNSWFYDLNWNYVSYLSITDSSLDNFGNPNTIKLFPKDIIDNTLKNGFCIIAAMITKRVGKYNRIENIITRIRGIGLSSLLFYEFNNISGNLIPGQVTEESAPYWAHYLFEDVDISRCSFEIFDRFNSSIDILSRRYNELEFIGKDWEYINRYLTNDCNPNYVYSKLVKWGVDEDIKFLFYYDEFKLVIKQLWNDEEDITHEFEWKGPIPSKSIPRHYSFKNGSILDFESYEDIAIFRGDILELVSLFEYILNN